MTHRTIAGNVWTARRPGSWSALIDGMVTYMASLAPSGRWLLRYGPDVHVSGYATLTEACQAAAAHYARIADRFELELVPMHRCPDGSVRAAVCTLRDKGTGQAEITTSGDGAVSQCVMAADRILAAEALLPFQQRAVDRVAAGEPTWLREAMAEAGAEEGTAQATLEAEQDRQARTQAAQQALTQLLDAALALNLDPALDGEPCRAAFLAASALAAELAPLVVLEACGASTDPDTAREALGLTD